MASNVGYEDAPAHHQRAERDRQPRCDREYVEETYIERKSRYYESSSRSRSPSSESRDIGGGGSGLGEIAAGKANNNFVRSKSRGSVRSYDSRSPVRRKRSQSISDYVNKGLAAVGLKAAADTHRSSQYEDDCSRNGLAAQSGKNGNSRSASNFSSGDSDLPSSSDEERQLKKKRKENEILGD